MICRKCAILPNDFARRWPWREPAEMCLTISVFKLRQKGVFSKDGAETTLSWWNTDRHLTDSVTVRSERDSVIISYMIYNARRGEPEYMSYPVSLVYTECHFGGSRPWFVCPGWRDGVSCHRRVGKLYMPPGEDVFLCRHCYDLTYASQMRLTLSHIHARLGRMLERAERRRRKQSKG